MHAAMHPLYARLRRVLRRVCVCEQERQPLREDSGEGAGGIGLTWGEHMKWARWWR